MPRRRGKRRISCRPLASLRYPWPLGEAGARGLAWALALALALALARTRTRTKTRARAAGDPTAQPTMTMTAAAAPPPTLPTVGSRRSTAPWQGTLRTSREGPRPPWSAPSIQWSGPSWARPRRPRSSCSTTAPARNCWNTPWRRSCPGWSTWSRRGRRGRSSPTRTTCAGTCWQRLGRGTRPTIWCGGQPTRAC